MHKIFLLAVFLIGSVCIKAQSPYYKNFDLEDQPPVINLTKEELNYKCVILNEFKAKELVVTADNDLEYYTFYSVTIYINNVDIIDKYNKVYIQYSSPSDLVTFKCRTTQPQGKSIELYKGDMKTITEDGDDYYILALEGLEKGSIIEYFYLKKVGVSYSASEAFNAKQYTKKYTSQIVCPDNLKYASKSYNGMSPGKDTTFSNRNFLSFSMTDTEPVIAESYTTDRAKLPRFEAKLDANTKSSSKKLNTYADVSKKMITNFHEMASDDEKAINKVYKYLKLEKINTVEEKLFAIESYIKNELGIIKYPGDLTLAQCIEKKGLSTFFQNKLTVALMEKCGITYEVVCTSYKDDQPFDPEFETYAFLDAVFFYIPEIKKYFMPNSILFRFGEIPATLTAQKGLFIKPIKIGETFSAINAIKNIEPMPGKNNYTNLECDITFKPADNKLSIYATHSFNGYPASNLRPYYFYYEEDKRKELLTSILKGSLKDGKTSLMQAANHNLKDFQVYNLPFICTGIVETKELAEVAGSDFIIKIGNCIGTQNELYQEGKRIYPIYTSYPHTFKRVLNFTIPSGYKVEGLEKLNMNVELKEGDEVTSSFTSSYEKKEDKIIITILESYNKEFYAKESFEGFRKVVNAAADFNKVSLLLKK